MKTAMARQMVSPRIRGDLAQHIGVGQEAQRRALLLVLVEGPPPLVVHQQIAVWIVSHGFVLIADMFMMLGRHGPSYTGMFMMVL